MKFIKTKFLVVIIFLSMLAMVNFSSAAGFIKDDVKTNINDNAWSVGDKSGYLDSSDDSVLTLIQTVINIFLSVIGVLLLTYIIYAGYNWMTAQGEEDKVTKAKETIQRAIVGVVIIIAAYAISVFVVSRIEAGTLRGASAGRTIAVISFNHYEKNS